MSTYKAYKVSAESSEASVITFASSETEAKTLAMKSPWMNESDVEWTELRATRLPDADNHSQDRPELLDGACARSQGVMWLLGWYPVEGGGMCDDCGHYAWDMVPESKLEDGVCAHCRQATKATA